MLGLVKDLVRQSKITFYEDGRAGTPPEARMIGEWDGNRVPVTPDLVEMNPVLEMLFAEDDPSRTDAKNPDVDLDFTLPLPAADIAHLTQEDDGFHDYEDEPLPPSLTPYQKAYLRARAPTTPIPGQMVSQMIPHGGRIGVAQATQMAPLHLKPPTDHGTSHLGVYRGHSKVSRVMVNAVGKFSQLKNMLHPKSPFQHPFKIPGGSGGSGTSSARLVSTVGSVSDLGASAMGTMRRSGATPGSGDVPSANLAGSTSTLSPASAASAQYAPSTRSPLRLKSISAEDGDELATLDEDNEIPSVGVSAVDVQVPPSDAKEADLTLEDLDGKQTPAVDAPRLPALDFGGLTSESTELGGQSILLTDEDVESIVDAAEARASIAFDLGTGAQSSQLETAISTWEPSQHTALDDYENSRDSLDSMHLPSLGFPVPESSGGFRLGALQGHSPLSAVPRSRFDFRGSTVSTTSYASSMSSFGEELPRRSFSEVTRDLRLMAPPGLGGSVDTPAPSAPPPGLVDFIENVEYSSDEDDDEDVDDDDSEDGVGGNLTRPKKVLPSSKSKDNGRVSLRRQFKMHADVPVKTRRSEDERLMEEEEQPKSWHLDPIHNDVNSEPGDPEAALRALEGALAPEEAKAKADRLEELINRVKRRKMEEAEGIDYSAEDRAAEHAFLEYISTSLEDEEDSGAANLLVAQRALDAFRAGLDGSGQSEGDAGQSSESDDTSDIHHPSLESTTPSSVDSTELDEDSRSFLPPGPDGAVGYEAFTFEFPVPTGETMRMVRYPGPGPQSEWLPLYEIPPPHIPTPLAPKRSWILDFRTDSIARHLSIIDRDLLQHLHFDQLVSLEWARPVPEITIYDWMWFIKWDAEKKAASRGAPYRNIPTISSVSALRARFNLVLMWTATEIVLTPSSDRATLVNKFIRLASVGPKSSS